MVFFPVMTTVYSSPTKLLLFKLIQVQSVIRKHLVQKNSWMVNRHHFPLNCSHAKSPPHLLNLVYLFYTVLGSFLKRELWQIGVHQFVFSLGFLSSLELVPETVKALLNKPSQTNPISLAGIRMAVFELRLVSLIGEKRESGSLYWAFAANINWTVFLARNILNV